MNRTPACLISTMLAISVTPALASAQAPRTAGFGSVAAESPPADDTAAANSSTANSNVVMRFVRDVGSDYKNFFSTETAWWLGVGGGAAWATHAADRSIADWMQKNPPSLPGGSLYGSQLVEIPVAIGWWIAGSAAGSPAQADAGRDLLRAQLSVATWTYGIKFATNRTRPNGDPHSFPSGHASTSFTVAMVLQEHFGWKAGIPAFAAATYTGISRLGENQHWASDIVFGAALGMASGRTVTIHMRRTNLVVSPAPMPGGMGLTLTALR